MRPPGREFAAAIVAGAAILEQKMKSLDDKRLKEVERALLVAEFVVPHELAEINKIINSIESMWLQELEIDAAEAETLRRNVG